MIRLVVAIIIAIHGLIHLIGAAHEYNFGQKILTGKTLIPFTAFTSKLVGILWFLVFAMFVIASLSYYMRKDWFWMIAGTALLLSQILIVLYWHDAKWGTAANVIVLFASVLTYAETTFERSVIKEVDHLTKAATRQSMIDSAAISQLPPVIRKWMKQSGVAGKARPNVIRVAQEGSMRTEPSGDWMPFEAEQFVTIDPPGFVWNARIHTDAYIDIVGRDKYENGKGNMLIKVASLIPIANSSGREIDQGTMIRYMAEMIWYPQAAASNYMIWDQIGDNQARLTMTHRGVTASGIYYFNEQGLPIAFEAQRWGDFDGKYSLEKWFVSIRNYREVGGLQIGTESEVTWKLKDGDFTWLRLTITGIQ